MSTETEVKKRKWHDVEIKGRWKLLYKVGNPMGPEAFGGKHLGVYASPYDMKVCYRKGINDEALNGYMLDKLVVDLHPDTNQEHKNLISWLICHPEVNIEGVPKLDQVIVNNKIANKVFLIALDALEIDKIDNEDYIDRIVGVLSLEAGNKSLGLDKIRYIMAAVGLTYFDNRYTGQAEKKSLRSNLKKFAKASITNATLVSNAIDDLDEAKDSYNFKEMVRYRILDFQDGLYKFNNVPLGSSQDKVMLFFVNHPEVRAEAIEQLYKILD